MATIGTSLCSAMKVVSSSISTYQKTAVASKIETRGSFFDQDSYSWKTPTKTIPKEHNLEQYKVKIGKVILS